MGVVWFFDPRNRKNRSKQIGCNNVSKSIKADLKGLPKRFYVLRTESEERLFNLILGLDQKHPDKINTIKGRVLVFARLNIGVLPIRIKWEA